MPATITMKADLVQGDTGSKVTLTLNDKSNNPIDLTGVSSVVLRFKIGENGAVRTGAMTVVGAPTAGTVEYTFVTGDLYAQGIMLYEVVITNADTTVLTSSDIGTFEVRAILS